MYKKSKSILFGMALALGVSAQSSNLYDSNFVSRNLSNFPACAKKADCSSRVGLFNNVHEAVQARLLMVQSANKGDKIQAQYFEAGLDSFTLASFYLLMNKARKGVEIEILFDSYATHFPQNLIRILNEEPNITVKFFRPFTLLSLFNGKYFMRMHDKGLNLNGKYLISGGRNFSAHYMTGDKNHGYEDIDYFAKGRVAKEHNWYFNNLWNNDDLVEYPYFLDTVEKVKQDATYGDNHVTAQVDLDEMNKLKAEMKAAWENINAKHEKEIAKLTADLREAKSRLKEYESMSEADLSENFNEFNLWQAQQTVKNLVSQRQSLIESDKRPSFNVAPVDEAVSKDSVEALISRRTTKVKEAHFFFDPPNKDKDPSDPLSIGNRIREFAKDKVKADLVIVNPYVVPTKKAMDTFKEMRNKNMNITIITNSMTSSDGQDVFGGFVKVLPDLLKMGIKVHAFKGSKTLHAKAAYAKGVDSNGKVEYLSLIGSFNLDPRSATLNRELSLGIVEGSGKGEHENYNRLEKTVQNVFKANSYPVTDVDSALMKHVSASDYVKLKEQYPGLPDSYEGFKNQQWKNEQWYEFFKIDSWFNNWYFSQL